VNPNDHGAGLSFAAGRYRSSFSEGGKSRIRKIGKSWFYGLGVLISGRIGRGFLPKGQTHGKNRDHCRYKHAQSNIHEESPPVRRRKPIFRDLDDRILIEEPLGIEVRPDLQLSFDVLSSFMAHKLKFVDAAGELSDR